MAVSFNSTQLFIASRLMFISNFMNKMVLQFSAPFFFGNCVSQFHAFFFCPTDRNKIKLAIFQAKRACLSACYIEVRCTPNSHTNKTVLISRRVAFRYCSLQQVCSSGPVT